MNVWYLYDHFNNSLRFEWHPKRPVSDPALVLYPPAREARREVANLTERKNPHSPVYGVKESSHHQCTLAPHPHAARPTLPVNPNPNPATPAQYTSGLHYTAAAAQYHGRIISKLQLGHKTKFESQTCPGNQMVTVNET